MSLNICLCRKNSNTSTTLYVGHLILLTSFYDHPLAFDLMHSSKPQLSLCLLLNFAPAPLKNPHTPCLVRYREHMTQQKLPSLHTSEQVSPICVASNERVRTTAATLSFPRFRTLAAEMVSRFRYLWRWRQ